jgi:hypothetical protein
MHACVYLSIYICMRYLICFDLIYMFIFTLISVRFNLVYVIPPNIDVFSLNLGQVSLCTVPISLFYLTFYNDEHTSS